MTPSPDLTFPQSTLDALADAETYRMNGDWGVACGAVGEMAHLWISWPQPERAYRFARSAAAIAFRAVPGLRGEEES